MTMPLKQHRYLFPQVVSRFPVAVQEMLLLMLVFLEDYSMIHETSPEEAIVINDAKTPNRLTEGNILRMQDIVSWFPSPFLGHKAFRTDKIVLRNFARMY
jgi:hypothetical protein